MTRSTRSTPPVRAAARRAAAGPVVVQTAPTAPPMIRVPVPAAPPTARGAAAHLLRDVARAPPGPAVAAVFDFDGTLIPGYSIFAFLEEQLRRRELGLGNAARSASALFGAFTGAIDGVELIARGLSEWAGRTVEQMEALGEHLFARRFEGELFPEMRALIEAHRERGHTIVLATSATRFQVEAAARHLGIEHVLCTQLQAAEGRLTGRIDGPLLYGPEKAEAVRRLASERGMQLAHSFFYADGDEDEALMHLVGQPRPTNPQARLARVAHRRGWPVTRLASRGSTAPGALVRSLAATASVVPVVASATAVRVLTGNRREAANLITSTVPAISLGLGQVKLDVVGEEHLWSARPAVFIWNHRNIFDAQIVGALVARDFGAVAKKELESVPLFRIASWFMPMAFVDRENHAAALEAIRPATRMLTEGWSMVIAPEGTRVKGDGIGHFKKGAFRMAMEAGVPVVPIVIRNADEVGGRHAKVPRPTRVDVAVLPPISVEGWSRENLSQHVAAVRQQFVDTLARWPAG